MTETINQLSKVSNFIFRLMAKMSTLSNIIKNDTGSTGLLWLGALFQRANLFKTKCAGKFTEEIVATNEQ